MYVCVCFVCVSSSFISFNVSELLGVTHCFKLDGKNVVIVFSVYIETVKYAHRKKGHRNEQKVHDRTNV